MISPAQRSASRLQALIRSPILPTQNRDLSFSSPKAKDEKNDYTPKPVSEQDNKLIHTQTKQSSRSLVNLPYDFSTPDVWKRSKAKSTRSIWEKSTVSTPSDKYDFGTGPVGGDIAHLERIWKKSGGEVVPELEPEQTIKSTHEQAKDKERTMVQDDVDDGGPKYVAYGPLFWNAEKRKKEKEAKEEAERKKEEETAKTEDKEGKK